MGDTAMSEERKIFMAHFQMMPFTMTSRKTLMKFLRKVTLKKVEEYSLISVINNLEGHSNRRVGIFIYTAEETKTVKRVLERLHKLEKDGIINLDQAGHSEIYGGADIEDDTIKIRM